MMLSLVSTRECTASDSIAELPVTMVATPFRTAIATFAAMAARIALFDWATLITVQRLD
jgi:hypothetical protein